MLASEPTLKKSMLGSAIEPYHPLYSPPNVFSGLLVGFPARAFLKSPERGLLNSRLALPSLL